MYSSFAEKLGTVCGNNTFAGDLNVPTKMFTSEANTCETKKISLKLFLPNRSWITGEKMVIILYTYHYTDFTGKTFG